MRRNCQPEIKSVIYENVNSIIRAECFEQSPTNKEGLLTERAIELPTARGSSLSHASSPSARPLKASCLEPFSPFSHVGVYIIKLSSSISIISQALDHCGGLNSAPSRGGQHRVVDAPHGLALAFAFSRNAEGTDHLSRR